MRVQLLGVFALLGALAAPAHAQYTRAAGHNAPAPTAVTAVDEKGHQYTKYVDNTPRDQYGNAQGNGHDLAYDGAFDGQTVAVLHFYTGEGFDFSLPKAALKEKGFSVYRWINNPPSPEELERSLKKACELWIISDQFRHLSDKHIAVIKRYFEAGHGVYIWGDNEPYYADANAVGEALLGVKMLGNLPGNQVVGVQKSGAQAGVKKDHLITTGLEHLYEGITIATIQPNQELAPLVYGSANNLVTAYYDKQGRRLLFDGGFTRLYLSWDTAGTARYVKNAAAWLANAERFHDVVAKTN